MRIVFTVVIDEEIDAIGESFFELLEAIVEEDIGCKVIKSKLETPLEVMTRGDWEYEEYE